MSKKQERIKYLVGIRNALNTGGSVNSAVVDGCEFCYHETLMKQVIATVDELLNMDGIVGIPEDGKVGEGE